MPVIDDSENEWEWDITREQAFDAFGLPMSAYSLDPLWIMASILLLVMQHKEQLSIFTSKRRSLDMNGALCFPNWVQLQLQL